MSMARRYITIDVRVDRDRIETGLWCDDCALPSCIDVPVVAYRLEPSGVSIFGRGRIVACLDCGRMTIGKAGDT